MSETLGAVEAARRTVQALIDGGVQSVVVAPGSRSAPLAYALAAAEVSGSLRLHVRVDERDGGFTALGLALGSGTPAAVLTTSGTAVGNLLPAVMEADHAGIPLVVLSADRPVELRGTGANQTTDQVHLFGSHARFSVDVPAGEDPTSHVAAGITAACGYDGKAPGPVQLNLAFRDPLVPEADEPVWTPRPRVTPHSGRAATRGDFAAPEPATTGRSAVSAGGSAAGTREERAARTVVVAGHGAGPVAERFAREHKLPLLAEPSSNARFGPNAVGPYRLLLEHLGPVIEKVVVFGRPTLSRPVAALLARSDLPRALYVPGPASWFTEGRRHERIIRGLAELSGFAGTGCEEWLAAWQDAGSASADAIESLLDVSPELTGLQVARSVWLNSGANLLLGSSNPVRDVDLAGRPQPQPGATVYANRGLAGIDGTVSTAGGIALATGRPTRVLLGDLTFLHDAGGLLLGPGEQEPQLQFVVLNDGGGGIFATLEHGELGEKPAYAAAVERLFGTPQTVDFAALSRAYGLAHREARSAEELDAALLEPPAGRSVIEVKASRQGLRPLHASIRAEVASAFAALGQLPLNG